MQGKYRKIKKCYKVISDILEYGILSFFGFFIILYIIAYALCELFFITIPKRIIEFVKAYYELFLKPYVGDDES